MRSRTSRGVPEWSGGKDLYMGSPVSAIGTSFGVIGIVPGPPEGSRGSTGWGHLSRRAPWAEVGRKPAHSGLGLPPWASPLCLGLETLGWGAPHLPWGASLPPGRRPPMQMALGRRPPSQGAYIKGGGRAATQQPWAPPSSPATPLPLAEAWRSPAETRYIHHHAVVLLDLHQPLLPPCWIKKEETSLLRTCVERGGAVRSALGHR